MTKLQFKYNAWKAMSWILGGIAVTITAIIMIADYTFKCFKDKIGV